MTGKKTNSHSLNSLSLLQFVGGLRAIRNTAKTYSAAEKQQNNEGTVTMEGEKLEIFPEGDNLIYGTEKLSLQVRKIFFAK